MKRLFMILLIFPLSAQAWDSLEQLTVPENRSLAPQERVTFNQSVNAMMNGENNKAGQLLAPLAASGITDAQVALGTLLSRSTDPDEQKEALKWFYYSAHAGVWRAQLEVAEAYRKGRHVTADRLKAYRWLNKALPLGGADVLEVMNTLSGDIYNEANDQLKAKKQVRAVELLTAIAEAGHLAAQEQLAKIYGEAPITQDRQQKMRMWYGKAAAQGSRTAQYELANLILAEKDVSKEDRNYAINLLERAADPGQADAQYQLGRMYMTGEGVPRDTGKGLYFYRIAAEQGHSEAQYSLAVRYTIGEGVATDDYEAHRWYKRAANEGHGKAQHNLALTYLHGMGTKAEPEKADFWFQKAAAEGVSKAESFLKTSNKKNLEIVAPEDEPRKKTSTKKNWVESRVGQKWFTKLPEKGFTIQVISGTKAQGVEEFLQTNGLEKSKYFHYVKHRGADSRHVVQWGYFSTYQEAKKAAIQISKGYTRFKPWIRSVDSVKKSLHS